MRLESIYAINVQNKKRELKWTHPFLHVLHRLSLVDRDGEVGRAFSETHNELSRGFKWEIHCALFSLGPLAEHGVCQGASGVS